MKKYYKHVGAGYGNTYNDTCINGKTSTVFVLEDDIVIAFKNFGEWAVNIRGEGTPKEYIGTSLHYIKILFGDTWDTIEITEAEAFELML